MLSLRSRRIIADAALAALGAAVALPLLVAITVLGFVLLAVSTGLRFAVPLLLDVGGPDDADGAVVTTGPLFAVAGALAFAGVAVLLFWARRRDPARRSA